MEDTYKPVVKLIGEDVNVYNIIGRCKRAAREAGWSNEEVKALTDQMFACHSYDAVLAIAMERFEVR